MDWKEIINQSDKTRLEAEQRAREHPYKPERFSPSEFIDFVDAKGLLEGIRNDVWGGLGEVVPCSDWFFLNSDKFDGPKTDMNAGTGFVLKVSWPYLMLKWDEGSYRNTGNIEVPFTNTRYNYRFVTGEISKSLAIVVARASTYPTHWLCVDTKCCVVGRIHSSSRYKGRIGLTESYNPYSEVQVWQNKPVKEWLVNELKSVVLKCRSQNDLPQQLKAAAARELEECRRNGGKGQSGNWTPYRGS